MIGKAAGHVPPHGGKAISQPYPVRARSIRKKVIVSPDESDIDRLVARKTYSRLAGQSIVFDRPIGREFALKALVVHVLVGIEQDVNAVPVQQVRGANQTVKIGIVVNPRSGLHCLPHHPEAQ